MSIKVLLVEDHTIIRASLKALLGLQPDLELVGETGDGQEAVELAARTKPVIVIMDVVLRESPLSGMEATKKITQSQDGPKVIALSVMEDLAYVKKMLSCGASGYLFKGCTEKELMEAIHTVLSGKTYFSKDVERAIHEDYVSIVQQPVKKNRADLTEREIEILALTAMGGSAKGIAGELNISRKTVDAHKRKLMAKLGIWSIAELTKYALRNGIISDKE